MILLMRRKERGREREKSYSGVRDRRLTVISCSISCSDWWDHPAILAGSPVIRC